MEQQNNRKEMYILSLDNGRLFWVVSISLLVLVFLFLLGYWIGRDAIDTPKAGFNYSQRGYQQQSNQNGLNNMDNALSSYRQGDPQTRVDLGQKTRTDMTTTKGYNPDLDKSSSQDRLSLSTHQRPKIDARKFNKTESTEFKTLTRKNTPVVKKKKRVVTKRVVRKRVVARKRVKRATSTRTAYKTRGKYAIQVASHSQRSTASAVRGRLQRSRFRAFISYAKVKGKRYYRIKVGNFSSYASARRELSRLKRLRLGRDSFIVTN